MSNPGTAAAGDTARAGAELQQLLANLSLPALSKVISTSLDDLGAPGTEPGSVKRAYGAARTQLNTDFDTSQEQSKLLLAQEAKQSGAINAPTSDAGKQLGYNLEVGRSNELRALNFQEAQAGLSQTNTLLSSLVGAGGNLLGGSYRFGQNAIQSDQILRSISQANAGIGSAAGGIIGAIAGTLIYPGIGTALGSGIGGLAGGFIGGGNP
jgi:hypothetical protein